MPMRPTKAGFSLTEVTVVVATVGHPFCPLYPRL